MFVTGLALGVVAGLVLGLVAGGPLVRRWRAARPAVSMDRRPSDGEEPPPGPDPGPPSSPIASAETSGSGASAVPLGEALEALEVGVIIAEVDGEVVFRNRSATRPTGAIHADVLVEEAVQNLIADALAGRESRRVVDLVGPPRTVVVVDCDPLPAGGALVTIEDVSERSRLEAVRTDFVANVSHELKTPVGAIAVLAEALVDEDDPVIVKRFVGKMLDEAHRVGRTIDDLLELSRIELGGEPVRQSVDVAVVIAEAVDRVRALSAARSIRVVVEQSGRTSVLGDRSQLVSALGNLVENAVKYSEEAGVVTVRSRQVEGGVDLVVEDTGIGIPVRDVDRIFERFYRVDRARSRQTGGTGLGLAIVRHVANNHGGDISVTSREGEGSVFVLHLPDTPTASGQAAHTGGPT